MADIDLMRLKFRRQLLNVAADIVDSSNISVTVGVQHDGTFVVVSPESFCYITLTELVERADGKMDYVLTFRLPMVHKIQRSAVLYEWIATHTKDAYFNRLICEGDDTNAPTTVTVEHHVLYESMPHRELQSTLVMLFGMYDKYAVHLQQAFGGKLPGQIDPPVYDDLLGGDKREDDYPPDMSLLAPLQGGGLGVRPALEMVAPKEKKSLTEIRADVHAIFAEIDTLVGLRSVRNVLEKIVARQWAADILKQRHPEKNAVFSKHLVFTGAY